MKPLALSCPAFAAAIVGALFSFALAACGGDIKTLSSAPTPAPVIGPGNDLVTDPGDDPNNNLSGDPGDDPKINPGDDSKPRLGGDPDAEKNLAELLGTASATMVVNMARSANDPSKSIAGVSPYEKWRVTLSVNAQPRYFVTRFWHQDGNDSGLFASAQILDDAGKSTSGLSQPLPKNVTAVYAGTVGGVWSNAHSDNTPADLDYRVSGIFSGGVTMTVGFNNMGRAVNEGGLLSYALDSWSHLDEAASAKGVLTIAGGDEGLETFRSGASGVQGFFCHSGGCNSSGNSSRPNAWSGIFFDYASRDAGSAPDAFAGIFAATGIRIDGAIHRMLGVFSADKQPQP